MSHFAAVAREWHKANAQTNLHAIATFVYFTTTAEEIQSDVRDAPEGVESRLADPGRA